MPSKKKNIKAYLSDEEFAEVVSKASMAQLSVSTYTKRVCLGYPITSRTDARALLSLMHIKGELGKIGGLLKLALKEKNLDRSSRVNSFLAEIDALKLEIQVFLQKLQ